MLSKRIKRIPVKSQIFLALNSSSFDVILKFIVAESQIYINTMIMNFSFVSSMYSLMEDFMLDINDVFWTAGISEMEFLLSSIIPPKFPQYT